MKDRFITWCKTDVGKTIITGIILAIIGPFAYSLLSSLIIPNREINGVWTVELETKESGYHPYLNSKTFYEFQIVQNEDNTIIGTGELVWDSLANGTIQKYETTQRDRVTFKGTIEQKIRFKKPVIFLEITDFGKKYTTTAQYQLELLDENNLTGTFTTTIAHGSGNIAMKRGPIE